MSVNIKVNQDCEKHHEQYKRIKILLENNEEGYGKSSFCIQLPNEPYNAWQSRKKVFVKGFRNPTQEILNSIADSIFKEKIRLEFDGEEKNPLWLFSKDVTMNQDNVGILQFAKDFVCPSLRAYGQVWTVIDKPNYDAANFEQEMKNGMPYISNIPSLNVLNWGMDMDGFTWFAYKVNYRPAWDDPTKDEPATKEQIRIWTRDNYLVVEGGKIIREFPHSFGFVPVVYQSFFLPPDENTIVGISPFFTTSNLIIMANNLLSVGNMELFKHGSSVLLVHEQAIDAMNHETDSYGTPRAKMQDAAGFNEYVWTGDQKPEYLVKNIESVGIANQQADSYFISAIDNERTARSILKRGVSGQMIAESGASKAFDMSPIMAGLRATAEDLQEWTRKVYNMVALMTNTKEDSFVVEYPSRFDIAQREMESRLNEIEKMLKVNYPSDYGIKAAFKSMTPILTQNTDEQGIINTEIDESTIESAEERLQREIQLELSQIENNQDDIDNNA